MLKSAELMQLLEDFYTLTGIRIVLFDERYRELCSFPSGEDTLCSCLRKNPEFDKNCRKCDERFFSQGQEGVRVYRCHAGLTEASVPLKRNQITVGYLMFGQITTEKDREKFAVEMASLCRLYGLTDVPEARIQKVKYRTEKQVLAAAKILEACAGYAINKDMVQPVKPVMEKIEAYIDSHLGEPLNADRLCKIFAVSRTGLYQLTKPYYPEGISETIKQKRLTKAKELLETTSLPVSEIAGKVGFNDYNYFLRVFKARFGHSSGYYRKK